MPLIFVCKVSDSDSRDEIDGRILSAGDQAKNLDNCLDDSSVLTGNF